MAEDEYTVVTRVTAAEDCFEEVLDAVLDAQAKAADVDGFVGYDVLAPVEGLDPIIVVSTWTDLDAFADAGLLDHLGDDDTVADFDHVEYESSASVVAEDESPDDADADDDADDEEEDGGDPAPSAERMFAVDLFNATWDLLDSDDRSAEDDRLMLGAALASRLHWRNIGEPKNHSISDWQVSRVFAELGDIERAEEYGAAALAIASEFGLGPFYTGYAEEALARSAALAGDRVARNKWLARAHASLEDIDDEGNRALLAADLDDIGTVEASSD